MTKKNRRKIKPFEPILSSPRDIHPTEGELKLYNQYVGSNVDEDVKKMLDKRREQHDLIVNPQAREINENLRRMHSSPNNLVCPECGETQSNGNKMNGKPYCYKCNVPMMHREDLDKYIPKPKKINRYLGYDLVDRVEYKGDRMRGVRTV
jgi:hypothetical protein